MSWPTLDPLPAGVEPVREHASLGATLCECHHDETQRRRRGEGLPDWCGVCKGDEHTTAGFTLAVKFMAVLPVGAQQGLFA